MFISVQYKTALNSFCCAAYKHINLSVCVQAAAYYIHGLCAYFSNNVSEAKRYLRETLKMSTAEDLNRLLATSLALLGHVFLTQGEV